MGQDWQIINLDKRATHGHWGKLGECLFDGSPTLLEASLRVQEFPDCDTLIFPFKPGQLLQEADSDNPEDYPAKYFPKTAPRSVDEIVLVNLPVETIREIYSHIDSLVDVVCLSMACQLLWEIGRGHLHRHIASIAASCCWAGDRIICIGDYLRNDDIPKNLLTPDEEQEFLGIGPEKLQTAEEEEAEDEEDNTLYGYPFDETPRDDFSRWNISQVPGLLERLGYDFYTYRTLASLCNTGYKSPTSEELRVLRNLSRRQYVRESVLRDLKARMPGKGTKDVGFGEVVLSRICCSSDGSVSMSYDGDIHRGVWAGDRFDIVSSEWIQGVDDEAGWADVSVEVLEEMEKIWRSEYGW
ncbi:hypothetical protein C8R44DRAFT_878237 [Mycena epipterygia]|nr:hypothetical protein C8R44DRAFT_878237 [Mycena epipterygia]